MIEFCSVSIGYSKDFYCLLDYNNILNSNTLFVGDFYNGANSIMRIISKIDKHYSGVVKIDNIDIKNIKDKNLSVAYLPEKPVMFNNKNIFNNLYYPLKIRKIIKNNAKNMVFSLIYELNLDFFNEIHSTRSRSLRYNTEERSFEECLLSKSQDDMKSKIKVKNLSVTQKKLLCLMRAILWKPKIILLENFFENFDETYLETAIKLLKKIDSSTLIIACEKQLPKHNAFITFDVTHLDN